MPLLFVYGSLMNCASRTKTLGHDARATVATIPRRYSVGWWFRSHEHRMTCLGMMEDAASMEPIRGMLLDVRDDDFAALDVREVGYVRVTLPPDVSPPEAAGRPVQTYLITSKQEPTVEFPITERYKRLCEGAALALPA